MKTLRLLLLAVLLAALPALADTSKVVAPGAQVTFSVTITKGTPPFGYQWQKDGVNIAGATNATYVIAAVIAADTGAYEVVMTNAAGSAKSDKGIFTVAVLPNGLIQITSP